MKHERHSMLRSCTAVRREMSQRELLWEIPLFIESDVLGLDKQLLNAFVSVTQLNAAKPDIIHLLLFARLFRIKSAQSVT